MPKTLAANAASLYSLTQAERDHLEALIDRTNLVTLVDALADIAADKAEHIRANWQDETTAGAWERAESTLRKAIGAPLEC